MFKPDGASCTSVWAFFPSTFRWTPGLGTLGWGGGGGGGIGVAPAPAASERKIWNFCHRAAEPLASIGELPPPSVFMMGGGHKLGMVPG